MSFQLKGVWVGPGGNGSGSVRGYRKCDLGRWSIWDQRPRSGTNQTTSFGRPGHQVTWAGQAWVLGCLFGPILLKLAQVRKGRVLSLFFFYFLFLIYFKTKLNQKIKLKLNTHSIQLFAHTLKYFKTGKVKQNKITDEDAYSWFSI